MVKEKDEAKDKENDKIKDKDEFKDETICPSSYRCHCSRDDCDDGVGV